MRRRLMALVVAMLAVASVASVARADVIEPYEDQGYSYSSSEACGETSWRDGVVDHTVYACAAVASDETTGDSGAAVWVGRYSCVTQGHLTRCEGDSGWNHASTDDVVIDFEAGVADAVGTIDDCVVELHLSATSDPDGGTYENTYEPWRVETRQLRFHQTDGYQRGSYSRDAHGPGVACDWLPEGTFDSGYLETYSSSSFERGYELHPEDAPVAGAMIERGEQETGRASTDAACASFWGGTAEGWTETGGCGNRTDSDGDGALDVVWAEAYRTECDDFGDCTEQRRMIYDLDESTVTVDFEAGAGQVDATWDACHLAFVVEPGEAGLRSNGSSRSDSDRLRLRPEDPGSVQLGASYEDGYEARHGAVGADPTVCEWDVSGADGYGRTERRYSTTSETYLAARPSRLLS